MLFIFLLTHGVVETTLIRTSIYPVFSQIIFHFRQEREYTEVDWLGTFEKTSENEIFFFFHQL